MHPLAKLDHRYVWHPFTQMRDWLKREPIIFSRAEGAVLTDVHGKQYLDANSSIWTNLHGHNHPKLNRALVRQLGKVAHTSALGFANEPASLLAERLITLCTQGLRHTSPANRELNPPNPLLQKVFFSDDGSTAMEVALKLAYQHAIRTRRTRKPRFLSLQGAYHGDTVGAVSLGHIDLFHSAYSGLLFPTDSTPAPFCYRCKHNAAKPDTADARVYRKCSWECIDQLEKRFKKAKSQPYSAFIFEPLMQGAAGMVAQPLGWLGHATAIAREHGSLLIADEVMTGFGRTGGGRAILACKQEKVAPDFVALAKGLTGGYLPMAATLTTLEIFNSFLGEYAEFKTFFHGHSYTGNPLGAATALASLEILQTRESLRHRARLESAFEAELAGLWRHSSVGDIRRVGLVAGVELVRDRSSRASFELAEQVGIRVCNAMAKRGVLTRPIVNVIVLMPPYCTTKSQLQQMIEALSNALEEQT